MVAILNFIFLAGATALVLPRDAATAEADLGYINGNVTALDTAIKNYSGGTFQALPVQTAANNLENAIKSATTDANNSGTVSDSDAETIIAYINNTLEPNIAGTLNDLVAKKSDFASAGLTGTVENTLETLKSDTDSYGSALLAKAPSDQQSSGQAALSKIDSDLSAAIQQFS